jgi:hypothetical protein
METCDLPPHLSISCTVKLVYEPGFRMKDLLKLLLLVLKSKLPAVGKRLSDATPAEHDAGATALAVTVTGVATEPPLFGAVRVMIPFEVEADANEAERIIASATDFIEAPGGNSVFFFPFAKW